MSEDIIDLLDATADAPEAASPMASYLEALASCRERLSARARDVLSLRYDLGLPGEEIARRMGRPINTIYVMIARLHRSLEHCIRRGLRGRHG